MHSLVQVQADRLLPVKNDPWANYVLGVAYFLRREGVPVKGANLCITGDIPRGAGLSSSAALEVAAAKALATLFGSGLQSSIDLVRICRQAENEFVGVHCGVMDQFVSVLGRAHHAVFLDCDSLTYEYVTVPPEVRLVICDTGVKRELTHSAYNQRRQECFFAVKRLAERYPGITSLREASLPQLEAITGTLDPVIRKRARHVIAENRRVLDSVVALRQGNLTEFGKLMYQSHLSLKLDFEVSVPELDAIVDICAEEPGVYGARMTGAGFGGSAVCLVDKYSVSNVRSRLESEFLQRTGRSPAIQVCSIEDGATVFSPV
jgi:galactokinase